MKYKPNAINKCWSERSEKGNALLELIQKRRIIFADIAMCLISYGKKEIINSKIKQLKEDIEDLNITIEELQVREIRLKKTGTH